MNAKQAAPRGDLNAYRWVSWWAAFGVEPLETEREWFFKRMAAHARVEAKRARADLETLELAAALEDTARTFVMEHRYQRSRGAYRVTGYAVNTALGRWPRHLRAQLRALRIARIRLCAELPFAVDQRAALQATADVLEDSAARDVYLLPWDVYCQLSQSVE